ncbi:hypothetical protein QTP88_002645 [Uroleucon formosanum]
MSSMTKTMQMVFDDLRSNRPKPLNSCNFNNLPIHKRFFSLPNMDVLTKSAAGAPEIHWKSAPNLVVPTVGDHRENIPESSKSCDIHGLPVNKRFVSIPNMDVPTNSAAEVPEILWKSAPDLVVPAVSDHMGNIPESSENCDIHGLPVNKKCGVSLPNMDVLTNSAGDAFEIGLPSGTSAEFPVSIDLLCAKVESGVQLTATDTVTSRDRDVPGMEPMVSMDNWFNSYNLQCKLKFVEVQSIGTVCSNRIAAFVLGNDKQLKSGERFQFDSRVDINNNIVVTKWHDNEVVHVISNYKVPLPVDNVKDGLLLKKKS